MPVLVYRLPEFIAYFFITYLGHRLTESNLRTKIVNSLSAPVEYTNQGTQTNLNPQEELHLNRIHDLRRQLLDCVSCKENLTKEKQTLTKKNQGLTKHNESLTKKAQLQDKTIIALALDLEA